MSIPYVTLYNDVKMPAIGLGTWRSPPDVVGQAIKDAIDVGYRHFDCAHTYLNESDVGAAIEEKLAEGVVKREELFITSKLWNTYHRPDRVRLGCEQSLKKLRLTYLDNYLIHFPTAFKEADEMYPKDADGKIIFSDVDYIDTWRAMEELVDVGLCRTIGISNFNLHQIERILAIARIPPSNLQVECHPYLNQNKLMDFCHQNGIVLTAYSPLGSPHTEYKKPGEYPILKHPKILAIAEKHNRNPGQILLRYQVQRGNVVIPRSVTKSHMEDNLKIFEFQLDNDEMEDIGALNINGRFNLMLPAAGHPHHPFENEIS